MKIAKPCCGSCRHSFLGWDDQFTCRENPENCEGLHCICEKYAPDNETEIPIKQMLEALRNVAIGLQNIGRHTSVFTGFYYKEVAQAIEVAEEFLNE